MSARRPSGRLGGLFGVIAPALLSTALCGAALAQPAIRSVWDVELGMHVRGLPQGRFIEPSCGTRGGPQGTRIGSFDQFARCPAEPGGLREIWFAYDDTAHDAALARRQPNVGWATTVLDQPVILSLLVDPDGHVQGYRIHTDSRADHQLRLEAHDVALHFRARFGLDGHCIDIAPGEGETPIDGLFVKKLCAKESDGLRIEAEERFFFRSGQQFYNPHTGQPMANAFESTARLEVVQTTWTQTAETAAVAEPPPVAEFGSAREAFLAGASDDCPGCDLVEADLRFRDLSGANLSGANLEGALLHRARLREADLSGANLLGANLNRTDLSLANLSGATLYNAMIYHADAPRADWTGADLSRAMMGSSNLGFGDFGGAGLDLADLAGSRLNDANLAGASMQQAFLPLAVLTRATLTGATAIGANLAEANLRGADLTGAILAGADLYGADLTGADLTEADFTAARLVSADLSRAIVERTRFTRARLPDNTIDP